MNDNMNNGSIKQQAAFFAAAASFAAMAENWIAIPVPFFRLGLSNIPVMLALEYFSFPYVAFIVMFKAAVSHLFRGTLLSVPFFIGLSGNVMYLLVCYPFWKIFRHHISFVSVSVLSALAHNVAQIMSAFLFLPAGAVKMIGSMLIPLGCVSGTVTGIIANSIYNKYLADGLPDIGMSRTAGSAMPEQCLSESSDKRTMTE